MDSKSVHTLASGVPKLTRKLDLGKFEVSLDPLIAQTSIGGRFRIYTLLLTAAPIALLADLNGGFAKAGFVSQTFSEEFKARPDYVTGSLFVAHRQDVPEFKHF